MVVKEETEMGNEWNWKGRMIEQQQNKSTSSTHQASFACSGRRGGVTTRGARTGSPLSGCNRLRNTFLVQNFQPAPSLNNL